ncbi:NUDIX domain-containing protein [Fulvivirga sedimenti]|uniref:NUDIX hydrolase n=1 Tax=Fulvivirga sedimenti TaxID=2879465 RepID=A0A9X1HTS6_9BACT|nr:NUDIX hydrolase [Fulvivirga sedimenti]MCA6074548.1 NUDIX hydrolase [Fulvivirga sedimenti]MCA6075725.1 NUDIX hydrolase [Fulvivirga sedimenti]MCA6076853.1 NUDIX hydrolase [Fulvivirga sedimenti]
MTLPVPVLLTVDIIVLASGDIPQILLIQRKNEPFRGSWALPGGFVDPDEDIPEAARRELLEETHVTAGDELIEVGVFGRPGRDPRGRTVSVAYMVYFETAPAIQAGDDAKEAGWFHTNNLPELAFDHQEIIARALNKLQTL